MELQDWLGIFGFGLALILAIWTFVKDFLLLRKRLVLILSFDDFTERASIILSNVGYRPITIVSIGAYSAEDENSKDYKTLISEFYRRYPHEFWQRNPPFKLAPGETEYFYLGKEVCNRIFTEHKIVRLSVFDATQKEYQDYTIQTVIEGHLSIFKPEKWAELGKKN